MQPNETQRVDPQGRQRTLMVIWGAIFMSVVLLFVLASVVGPEQSGLARNSMLTIVLTAIGTLLMVASYFLRQKMLTRAFGQRRAETISSAYIVAFAMCEAAAICGLLLRFMTNERSYYFLFVMAVLGLILNLPRQDDIIKFLGQESGVRNF
jgi:NADH:ubiquinone oxidoreductase subunit 2 (subunit N)